MKRRPYLAGFCLIVTGLFTFSASLLMSQTQSTGIKDPRIVIRKSARELELFDGDKLVKKYDMALGFTPAGDKEISGDGKTPEGEFYVFVKNDQSKFYLSLGLSYPNAEDAKRGLTADLITRQEYDLIMEAIAKKQMPLQETKLGGAIYIHGGGVEKDWTWGCIGLDNTNMKEIYDSAVVGMYVTIMP